MDELQVREKQGQLLYDIPEESAEGLMSLKMLEHNKIPGLLPVFQQHVDNRLCLSYEIQNMVSLQKQYEHKEISVKRACQLIKMVIDILLAGEQFFLLPEEYCVNFSHIYLNRGQKQIYLCYLPDVKQDFPMEFRRLLECLMERLNHNDKQAVSFFYAFYDMYCAEELSLIELSEHILLFEQENGSLAENDIPAENGIAGKNQTLAGGMPEKGAEYIFSFYQANALSARTETLYKKALPEQFICSEGKYPVGRREGSAFYLLPQRISREHAEIEIIEGQVYITDRDSRNGTFVNERKLAAHVRTHLKSGDIVSFADISYQLRINSTGKSINSVFNTM